MSDAEARAKLVEALYFGCWYDSGHYLHRVGGSKLYDPLTGMPWTTALMDTGLLKNGNHKDIPDGRVWWTCGGKSVKAQDLWYAFFWWDRSIDKRGNSNSGFYVRGFDWPKAKEAFDFACQQFPRVISRQKYQLVLQDAERGSAAIEAMPLPTVAATEGE
ncbi:hypothetical protein ACELLULO517_07485 [Acidisoma cellulosilytica]|uniref:Uncharacterized protein n=1 Tax=Acidisoma cellulosilyticum TaxID=2802395 RepID=A0A963YZI3_9PROT|nr:hypothetical protein [Acidisoma cellulosilyticum]MCB8880072.1 hypothetical protein [Acidisoma cellulosilyticum]